VLSDHRAPVQSMASMIADPGGTTEKKRVQEGDWVHNSTGTEKESWFLVKAANSSRFNVYRDEGSG